jgi:hypothetical protein
MPERIIAFSIFAKNFPRPHRDFRVLRSQFAHLRTSLSKLLFFAKIDTKGHAPMNETIIADKLEEDFSRLTKDLLTTACFGVGCQGMGRD